MTIPTQRTTLDDVIAEFRTHLWLRELGPLYFMLAAIAAGLLHGDPVWGLIIGPSSSGKSELLGSLRRIEWCHFTSTFTEAGMLSGARGGRPGLLQRLGEFGFIVFSDMTTVLSKLRTERDAAFGVIREVYDGRIVRNLGFGPIEWEGKANLLAGCTEAVDDHDFGVLGERFIRLRMPAFTDEDVDQMGALILEDVHHRPEHRRARQEVVAAFVSGLDVPDTPPSLRPFESIRLNALAALGARCRSSVIRDSHHGDVIVRVGASEAPGRLLGQLAQLLAGMRLIGVPEDVVWPLVVKVAMDGMHPMRWMVLECLVASPYGLPTAEVAARCFLPQTSVRRQLQDLAAHGVLTKTWEAPETWVVSDWTKEQWWAVEGDDR